MKIKFLKLFLILLLFVSEIYALNRTVPIYIGPESVGRASMLIIDQFSTETFYFNPSIINEVKTVEFAYNVSSGNISALSYKFFKNDFGLTIGMFYYPAYHQSRKYNSYLYSLSTSIDIAGLLLGLNLNYDRLSYEQNIGNGFDFSIGIKKTGLFEGRKIDVALAYRKETTLNWKNETYIIEKLPSQISLGTILSENNFDFTFAILYLFPVSKNEFVNVVSPIYDDEIRVSFSFSTILTLLLKFKFNLGYQQIFDHQVNNISKKFIGIGLDFPLKKLILKVGYNSNNIIEKSEEKIENFSIGLSLNLIKEVGK